MGNKKRSSFASFIGAVYIITLVVFIISVGFDISKGKEAAEKRFRKLTNETAESLKEDNPRSEAFYESFLHSLGNVSDLAGVQIKDAQGPIIAYPADIGEEGVHFSRGLTDPFTKSTKLNAKNGQEVTLTAAIYLIKPTILYNKLRITFLVILAATLICLLYLIYLSLYGTTTQNEEDEQVEIIEADDEDEPEISRTSGSLPEETEATENQQQPVASPQPPSVIVNVNAVPGGAVTTETIRSNDTAASPVNEDEDYGSHGFGNYELTQEEYDGLLSDEIDTKEDEDLDDFDPDEDDGLELEVDDENNETIIDDSSHQDPIPDVNFDEENDDELFDNDDDLLDDNDILSEDEPSFVPGDAFDENDDEKASDEKTLIKDEEKKEDEIAEIEQPAEPPRSDNSETIDSETIQEQTAIPEVENTLPKQADEPAKEAQQLKSGSNADDDDTLFENLDDDLSEEAAEDEQREADSDHTPAMENSDWTPREIPSIDDSIFETEDNDSRSQDKGESAEDDIFPPAETESTIDTDTEFAADEREEEADHDSQDKDEDDDDLFQDSSDNHEEIEPAKESNSEPEPEFDTGIDLADIDTEPVSLETEEAATEPVDALEAEPAPTEAEPAPTEAEKALPIMADTTEGEPSAPEAEASDTMIEPASEAEVPAIEAEPAVPQAEADETATAEPALEAADSVPEAEAVEPEATSSAPAPTPVPSGPSGLFSARTGFGWESYMMPRVDNEILRCTKSNQDISVISLRIADIDWTTDEGQAICRSVKELLNSPDLIFEKGDDAFTAALPDTNVNEAISVAEDLYASIDEILAKYGSDNIIGIGISSRSLRMISGERLSNEAEVALNHAMEDESSPIVAFKVDPQKYRNFLAAQAEKEEASK